MKKDIVIAAVAVVVVFALAFGVSQLRPNLPPTQSQPYAGGSERGGRKLDPNEKVVMRVNGEPVTDREFLMFIESVPPDQRTFYTTPAGRRALADEIIRIKVLEQEARRLGLTDDPSVRQQIEMARTQITAARALEKLADKEVEAKVRAAFDKEKGNTISLRHILVSYAGGAIPPRNGQQPPPENVAMQRAQALTAKLRGGADFGRTAIAESDHAESAPQGGMIGTANPASLPPEIGSAVSKLRPGQISDPVKTQLGIHIFRVDEPSLDDLGPALRQRIRQETAQSELQRLQTGAKVDLDPKFFPGDAQQPPTAPKSQG